MNGLQGELQGNKCGGVYSDYTYGMVWFEKKKEKRMETIYVFMNKWKSGKERKGKRRKKIQALWCVENEIVGYE